MPGLKVVAPYSAEDARGLLKSAIRDPNPVVVLEHELMYGTSFELDEKVLDPDFLIPFGKAKIERSGSDITIVTFSRAVSRALDAAQLLAEEGISAEVINLRSLRPLDEATIVASVMKTNRIITLEEGWPRFGVGSEIAAVIMESDAFDYLDAPLERITGADVPMPYAENLEKAALPQVEDVVNVAKRVMDREL